MVLSIVLPAPSSANRFALRTRPARPALQGFY
jgi:hypothetical protein